jgi:hypothetical protein
VKIAGRNRIVLRMVQNWYSKVVKTKMMTYDPVYYSSIKKQSIELQYYISVFELINSRV